MIEAAYVMCVWAYKLDYGFNSSRLRNAFSKPNENQNEEMQERNKRKKIEEWKDLETKKTIQKMKIDAGVMMNTLFSSAS